MKSIITRIILSSSFREAVPVSNSYYRRMARTRILTKSHSEFLAGLCQNTNKDCKFATSVSVEAPLCCYTAGRHSISRQLLNQVSLFELMV